MSFANFPWFVAKTAAGTYSGWMLQRFIPAQGAQRPDLLWGTYLLGSLLTPLSLFLLRRWLIAGLSAQESRSEHAVQGLTPEEPENRLL